MITHGVITALVALLSLAMQDGVAFEGLIAFIGLPFVLSPWSSDSRLSRLWRGPPGAWESSRWWQAALMCR
jgi:hypothetical protein